MSEFMFKLEPFSGIESVDGLRKRTFRFMDRLESGRIMILPSWPFNSSDDIVAMRGRCSFADAEGAPSGELRFLQRRTAESITVESLTPKAGLNHVGDGAKTRTEGPGNAPLYGMARG